MSIDFSGVIYSCPARELHGRLPAVLFLCKVLSAVPTSVGINAHIVIIQVVALIKKYYGSIELLSARVGRFYLSSDFWPIISKYVNLNVKYANS